MGDAPGGLAGGSRVGLRAEALRCSSRTLTVLCREVGKRLWVWRQQ